MLLIERMETFVLIIEYQNKSFSRLAGIALLVLQEEEDAFWCLVAIADCIMPEDYYSKTLTGSQVRDSLASLN